MTRMTPYHALKLAEEGRPGAQRLVALMRDPARTLNILALLVIVVQVAAIALLTLPARPILSGGLVFVAACVLGAAVLFVVADVAPRTLALQRTDQVACRTARWVALIARPLSPFARLLIQAGNVLAPGKGLPAGPFVTEDALRELIDVAESDEVIELSERAMIHSIFETGRHGGPRDHGPTPGHGRGLGRRSPAGRDRGLAVRWLQPPARLPGGP